MPSKIEKLIAKIRITSPVSTVPCKSPILDDRGYVLYLCRHDKGHAGKCETLQERREYSKKKFGDTPRLLEIADELERAYREEVVPLVEALRDIRDYWNMDKNEKAMGDALDHIVEVSEGALAVFDAPAPEEPK